MRRKRRKRIWKKENCHIITSFSGILASLVAVILSNRLQSEINGHSLVDAIVRIMAGEEMKHRLLITGGVLEIFSSSIVN